MKQNALTLPPLGLYIHIPWCVKKCPYCDFNSHHRPQVMPELDYVNALIKDFASSKHYVQERKISSVFFGGGTPSLFAPDSIARILQACDAISAFAEDVEVTLESNPGTIEHGRFDAYAAAGINRVSLGVQSFDDEALKKIGRIHDGTQARRAAKEAQDAGIDNLNLDLMFALPGQTLEAAILDIDAALDLSPTHISHYQLTLEPNTEFAAKPPKLPNDDLAWEMQEQCQLRLSNAGFLHYEVSAYARSQQLRSRHNLNYWEFGDYLGIGAGAHGKITLIDSAQSLELNKIVRLSKPKVPRFYLDRIENNEKHAEIQPIADNQLGFEFMLNAMRLCAPVLFELFEQRTGCDRSIVMPALLTAQQKRLLDVTDEGFVLNPDGRRLMNEILQMFLP